jgi:hypothetical protein
MADDVVCKHGILLTKYRCKKCESEKLAHMPAVEGPPPPDFIMTRIVFKNGQGSVDVRHARAGFNLPAYVNIVKGCGGVMTEQFHVPWDNILMIFAYDNEAQLQQAPIMVTPKKNEVN